MNDETKKEIKEIISKISDSVPGLVILFLVMVCLIALCKGGIIGMIFAGLLVLLLIHEQYHS